VARRFTLDFLKTQAAAGAVLGLAAVAALAVANSALSPAYFTALKSEHTLQVGPLLVSLSLSEWIKEGLMALFFLIVGLEIKYEILKGELSDPRRLATPVLAALGGMIAPALVYLTLVPGLGAPVGGWPIPLATDIAFALAVFGLVARGLPSSLRVFLLTLAIVDDLGAIALIAVLFSSGIEAQPLMLVLGVLAATALVARLGKVGPPFWALAFAAVWYLSIQAGLSTSLTAVAFAATVPVAPRVHDGQSPLQEAIHDLHPWNAYLVLPLFAFAKAGVSFAGLSLAQVFAPLAVAIAMGLFLGKQAGVMTMTWLATRLRIGRPPSEATWLEIYGVSLLTGIGFTMSLFVGALAFPGAVDAPEQVQVKLGVIGGSLLSTLAAAAILAVAARRRARTAPPPELDPR